MNSLEECPGEVTIHQVASQFHLLPSCGSRKKSVLGGFLAEAEKGRQGAWCEASRGRGWCESPFVFCSPIIWGCSIARKNGRDLL